MEIENGFLPIYKIGIDEFSDGKIIKLCEFCKKNRNTKCEKFYKEIFHLEGLHICPYGFNSYVLKDNDVIEIFTGFRVKGEYNIQKANPKVSDNYSNKIINKEEMHIYIDEYKKMCKLSEDYNKNNNFLGNMVHDIRKFNANIKGKGELLMNNSHNKTKKDRERILEYSKNILAMSEYITTKLKEYDYLYAESPWKTGDIIEFNFFRSFDKIRRCLQTEAKKEEKIILLSCQSSQCSNIESYSNIDIVPFLIVDNAVKYSSNKTNIEINIKDKEDIQIIEIKSFGIYVEQDEIENLFKRGYRGKGACCSNKTGSGIGLYLIKNICDANSIDIKIESEKTLDISSKRRKTIDEGYFKVILYLKKD